MSDTEPDPETLEAAKEIHDKKDDVVGEMREQHDELLEAAAEGEEAVIEEYDTAEIGDAELTVKTQIAGEQLRQLDALWESDLVPGQQLDVIVDLLTEQTKAIEARGKTAESDSRIRLFFRDFIDRNDFENAAKLCMERVIEEPNGLEKKRREEAIESFPGNESSPSDRSPREWRS